MPNRAQMLDLTIFPNVVFIHLFESPQSQPENFYVRMGRVPIVGEHIAFKGDKRHWVVTQLIHIVTDPDSDSPTPEFSAEVYCLQMAAPEVEEMMRLIRHPKR